MSTNMPQRRLRGSLGEHDHGVQTLPQGCTEMLQIDVRMTADGQVVVCHDNDLTRLTGVNQKLSELKYEELPPLLDKLEVFHDPGVFVEARRKSNEIPLLSTVFTQFHKIPICIQVKEDSDELIEKTNELIVRFKRKDYTIWGSASAKISNKCHKQNAAIPLYFSVAHCFGLIILLYSGMLPFVKLKESFLLVAFPKVMLRRFPSSRIMKVFTYAADWLLLSPILIRHLRKRGIQTYIWVLNKKDEFTLAFEKLGAAGVMTDYPTELSDYVEQSVKSKRWQ
ncbi:predicted protein [Nematostella vectensis]|uniref:GP-PDE domain-containing protein n=1 Tax=Nematostella vectensis TaxID=45351 RepID=A7T110_NEMVE|nr:predicted protein [Nematostella vectensis]|eukprot:XP_001622463.1 predicted protein [Nematostella vectensis]